jgi:pantoate--beta-alanine ligase
MAPFDVTPEYLALVDPDTLEPLERLGERALIVIAARIGGVRLIDNTTLRCGAGSDEMQRLQGGVIATCSA